ncbi:MAG: hypothetical protein VYA96_00265, partial [Verrucomicrobiota bacterium]|nr:hypothetical protein [Verrucomicrobiota bacterium]
TGSSKAAPLVGDFFNALYDLKKERGELEDYTKTAVATTFSLPDDEENEENLNESASEESNPLRRFLSPFRRRR